MKNFSIMAICLILSGCGAGAYSQSGRTEITDCGRDGLCASRTVEHQGRGSAASLGFLFAPTGYGHGAYVGAHGNSAYMGYPSMVPQFDSTVVVLNDGAPSMAGHSNSAAPTRTDTGLEKRVDRLEERSEKLREGYQKLNRSDELIVNVMGRTLKLNQATCRAFFKDPEGAVKDDEARAEVRTACNQIPGVSE